MDDDDELVTRSQDIGSRSIDLVISEYRQSQQQKWYEGC